MRQINKTEKKIKLDFIGWIFIGTMALRMSAGNFVSLMVCKAALFLKWIFHFISDIITWTMLTSNLLVISLN